MSLRVNTLPSALSKSRCSKKHAQHLTQHPIIATRKRPAIRKCVNSQLNIAVNKVHAFRLSIPLPCYINICVRDLSSSDSRQSDLVAFTFTHKSHFAVAEGAAATSYIEIQLNVCARKKKLHVNQFRWHSLFVDRPDRPQLWWILTQFLREIKSTSVIDIFASRHDTTRVMQSSLCGVRWWHEGRCWGY